MKVSKIKKYYQFVLNELNSFETNIAPLLQFAREYNENITSILQSFLGAAKIYRDGTDTHYVTSNPSLLTDFSTLIKDFKSSFLVFPAFLEYGSMKSRISDYKSENNYRETEIEKFYSVLDDTFTTYQEFLQSSDDRKKAILFGQSVIKLEQYFASLKVSYENTIAMLSEIDVDDVPSAAEQAEKAAPDVEKSESSEVDVNADEPVKEAAAVDTALTDTVAAHTAELSEG